MWPFKWFYKGFKNNMMKILVWKKLIKLCGLECKHVTPSSVMFQSPRNTHFVFQVWRVYIQGIRVNRTSYWKGWGSMVQGCCRWPQPTASQWMFLPSHSGTTANLQETLGSANLFHHSHQPSWRFSRTASCLFKKAVWNTFFLRLQLRVRAQILRVPELTA